MNADAKRSFVAIDAAEKKRLVVVLGAAAALVVVAAVYASVLRAPFIWDDHVLLEQTASFHTSPLGSLFTQPFWPDTSAADGHVPYYRPLTLLSYRFDLILGGAADQFHFTNVALHMVATALLAFTATRLGASGRAAVVAALLWAIAPRLTESVAWISGRTDVLAAVFGLGALAVVPTTRRDAVGGPWWRFVLAGVLTFAGLLSMESALAFVAVLMVAALTGERSRKEKAVATVFAVLPLASYGVLRFVAMRHHGATRSFELSWAERGFTVLEAVGRYVEMTVDALRPKTSIGLIGELDRGRVAFGAALVVATVGALVRYRRRIDRGVLLAGVLGVSALALVVHVAPLNLSSAVTADRLLYVPLLGLAIGLAIGVQHLRPRQLRTAAIVSGVGVLLLAGATKARLDDYGSEARFWLAAAEGAHVHNSSPRNGLAGVVVGTDDVATACRLYETSLSVMESSGRAGSTAHRRTRENLAACWAREGRYKEALALTEQLANDYRTNGRIKLALGYARLHLLDFDGTEQAWNDALAVDKGLRKVVQAELKDLAKTRKDAALFADGAAKDPAKHADFLGRIGRLPEAEEAFARVIRDKQASIAHRLDATRFLVQYGHLAIANEALEYWTILGIDDIQLPSLRQTLAGRTVEQASVTALRPRIEAMIRKETAR